MAALSPEHVIHAFLSAKGLARDKKSVAKVMQMLLTTHGLGKAVTTASCLASDPDNVIDNSVFSINDAQKNELQRSNDPEFEDVYGFFNDNIVPKCGITINAEERKKIEFFFHYLSVLKEIGYWPIDFTQMLQCSQDMGELDNTLNEQLNQ